ncbi:para-nitrobenzyl esterase, partial [Aplysia californica]|uniref:Para-nitrobenzyl esterase n=1 Tax=Aplysia californica TaxID=6500 RepID=A0ABM0JSP8_APLCA
MFSLHILCYLWGILLMTVVGGASARRGVERHTKYGNVKGVIEAVHGGHRVEKFLGIPYAKPPVGELRFEAPEAPDTWQGTKRTVDLPPACPQPRMGVDYINIHVPGFNRTSEDCLYLNIYAPRSKHRHRQRHVKSERPSSTRLAVIVFVHGGSY